MRTENVFFLEAFYKYPFAFSEFAKDSDVTQLAKILIQHEKIITLDIIDREKDM